MKRILSLLLALWPVFAFAQSFPIQGGANVVPQAGSYSNGSQGVPIGAVPTTNGGWVQNWPDQTKQLFVDDFSTGTLNTINRWRTPTSGTGGTAASNATGQTTLAGGTSANGFSALSTQLIFFDKNPGYLFFQANINLSNPSTTNTVEFIGFGTIPTTPTAAAYCTDCVGFEDGTDGKLRAVTWASGARTIIADLSVTQGFVPVTTQSLSGAPGSFSGGCACNPQHTDTGSYKYVIYFRGDNILWYMENQINGQLLLVAYTTRGALGPDVNQLPASFVIANGTSGPATQSTMQINQVTVGDSSGNPITAVSSVAGSASSSLVLKAAAGHLISAYANCTAACWLMIFNSATAPGDGATTAGTASGGLQDCIPIAAGGIGSINYTPQPFEFFSVGITAVISSTACATKTASTVGFIHGTIQ
jgi:hypothetical protein